MPATLIRPRSVPEAVSALAAGARPVAGATALLVGLARGEQRPPVLVDLTTVDELATITATSSVTRLGAAVTLDRVAALGGVVGGAAALVATSPVRRQATIGGNLCAPGWPRDLVPALWCAGATIELAGPTGRRALAIDPPPPAGDSHAPLGAGRDEVVVRVHVPAGRGAVVTGAGPTPGRPALRLLAGTTVAEPGAWQVAIAAGEWWRPLPGLSTRIEGLVGLVGRGSGAQPGVARPAHPPAGPPPPSPPRRALGAAAEQVAALGVPGPVAAALVRRLVTTLGGTA